MTSESIEAPARLGSRTAYRNPWMSVREDTLVLADGSTGIYGIVDQDDFAVVIAEEDGGFHLVEQFRYAVGRRSWEFPMGTWPAGQVRQPEGTRPAGTAGGDRVHRGHLAAGGLADARLDRLLLAGLRRLPRHRADRGRAPTGRTARPTWSRPFVSEDEFRRMIARRPDLRRADHRRLRRCCGWLG